MTDDVTILVECVGLIKRQLTQDLQLRVEYDLHRGLDPILTIRDIAEQICGKYVYSQIMCIVYQIFIIAVLITISLNNASAETSLIQWDLMTKLEKK